MDFSRLKHIFFDLDHTLWDYDKNSAEALDQLYHLFALDEKGLHPKSAFIESFHKANIKVWNIFNETQLNRYELRNKRMELVFEDFEKENQELEGFHEAYYQLCSRGNHLMPGCLETLEHLSDKYNLHIITNGFEDAQHAKLKHSGIDHFFKTVTTSEKANSKKPEEAYFNFALDFANSSKTDSLVIGDGLRTDVIGARNSNIEVIWFNPDKNENPFPEVISITKLNELMEIL